tara:strand:- start:2229 stop:2504 length:276 start_codon:yes stop_codon:yes gene_type:complete
MNMNENIIVSPCITVCKTDPITGYCYGCGRSLEDKKMWSNPETNNHWKEKNLETIRNRLSGWQQIAFDESYKNKKKSGLSLIKQKLNESKK